MGTFPRHGHGNGPTPTRGLTAQSSSMIAAAAIISSIRFSSCKLSALMWIRFFRAKTEVQRLFWRENQKQSFPAGIQRPEQVNFFDGEAASMPTPAATARFNNATSGLALIAGMQGRFGKSICNRDAAFYPAGNRQKITTCPPMK